MRGAHTARELGIQSRAGPSVRARGAPMAFTFMVILFRTIRACAGHTWRLRSSPPLRWDHPCVRGAHTRYAALLLRGGANMDGFGIAPER